MGLSQRAYRERTRALISRIARLPALTSARLVQAWWPLLDRREIDLRPLIAYLRARGCTIVLPRVDFSQAPYILRCERYEHERDLVANRWGILEPPATAAIDPAEIDVVLVPALAVDRRGHRLGYGKGFYDRMLGQIEAFKVGAVFEACVFDCIPTETHDVPVDIMVTELNTIVPADG